MKRPVHTPGPWHTEAVEFNTGKYPLRDVMSVTSEGAVLAHVNCNFGVDSAEANARLIAAAPELYAALLVELAALIEQRDTGATILSRDARIARLTAALKLVRP